MDALTIDFTTYGLTPAQSDRLNEIELTNRQWTFDDWSVCDDVMFSGLTLDGQTYVTGMIDSNGHVDRVKLSPALEIIPTDATYGSGHVRHTYTTVFNQTVCQYCGETMEI